MNKRLAVPFRNPGPQRKRRFLASAFALERRVDGDVSHGIRRDPCNPGENETRLGGEAIFYRTIFLEEISKDYVRTARAKGLSEPVVLFKHVLRNALLPILTSTVAVLPLLFLGALLMESFFGIPGLGSYTIDAINAQDFAVVRVMVFVGSALYIVGLILTDISYSIADPRIRLR